MKRDKDIYSYMDKVIFKEASENPELNDEKIQFIK